MKDYPEAKNTSELGTDKHDIYLGDGQGQTIYFSGARKMKQELEPSPWWYAVILVGVAVAGFFIGAWL